eukprot:Sdes_comp20341_c0_seq1m14085
MIAAEKYSQYRKLKRNEQISSSTHKEIDNTNTPTQTFCFPSLPLPVAALAERSVAKSAANIAPIQTSLESQEKSLSFTKESSASAQCKQVKGPPSPLLIPGARLISNGWKKRQTLYSNLSAASLAEDAAPVDTERSQRAPCEAAENSIDPIQPRIEKEPDSTAGRGNSA